MPKATTKRTDRVGPLGWIVLAVVAFVGTASTNKQARLAHAAGGAAAVATRPREPGATRAGVLTKGISALVALMLGASTWWMAWNLVPKHSLADPEHWILGKIDTRASLIQVGIGVSPIAENLWKVRVALVASGDVRLSPHIEIDNVKVAACDALREEDVRRACEAAHPRDSSEDGSQMVVADPVWEKFSDEKDAANGGLLSFAMAISATPGEIGLRSDDSGAVVVLPSFVFNDTGPEGKRVEAIYSVDVPNGSQLQWSGLMPQQVSDETTRWEFLTNGGVTTRNVARATNSASTIRDQQFLLVAGTLAGIAGTLLVGFFQEGAGAVMSAIGKRASRRSHRGPEAP